MLVCGVATVAQYVYAAVSPAKLQENQVREVDGMSVVYSCVLVLFNILTRYPFVALCSNDKQLWKVYKRTTRVA